jgi:uncharacterized protein (TIGR03067 family)
MRFISIAFILALALTSAITKPHNMFQNKMNGTWVPTKQEIGGTDLPAAAFEKQKLIISDSTYTVIAENTDKGTVKYKDDKMDIYGKDGPNAGKHFTAIYKFENDQLTICYDLSGSAYPENFETKGKPMYFLAVFKKETAK